MTPTTNTASTDPATCRHGLSGLIEPPDEQGWMRESCGECGQILRWTLWPHHARALAATAEDGEECTCASCADTVERRTIELALRDLQGDREQVREELGWLDTGRLQQIREGALRLARCAQTEIGITHANP